MLCHDLDNTEYGCLVEIVNELLTLFQITEIIASWNQTCDLMLCLTETIEPQITAEASLGGQLPVPWKVIVELIWLQIIACSLQVLHIETDMELQ